MKGLVVTALLMIGIFPSAAGRASMLSPTEQEVINLTRQFNKASLGKYDIAAYERILAPDFYMINSEGVMLTRAEVLAQVKSGVISLDTIDTYEISARIYGKGAIVVEHGIATGQAGGKKLSEEYRSTKLYINREGRWQMATAHVTRVPPNTR